MSSRSGRSRKQQYSRLDQLAQMPGIKVVVRHDAAIVNPDNSQYTCTTTSVIRSRSELKKRSLPTLQSVCQDDISNMGL